MDKLFKKLIGNRIYLELPEVKKSDLILSEETLKSVYGALKEKDRFKVFAVGDSVSIVEVGDEVRVDGLGLARSEVVRLSDNVAVLQVSVFDIAHIW